MFVARSAGTARGQTLIETVIMLPVVLLVLFGILYVARLGVVNERAQLALRYGGIAAFDTGTSAYSAANIYANLSGAEPPSPCPTPPAGAFSNGTPFPGPTSAPFWQPDPNATPNGTCTLAITDLGGAQFLASHYFAATSLSVTAGVDIPSFLQGILGGQTTNIATISDSFVHAAYPGIILYCSSEVRSRVQGAITAQGSSTPPTPIPNGSTPPPAPPYNIACQ